MSICSSRYEKSSREQPFAGRFAGKRVPHSVRIPKKRFHSSALLITTAEPSTWNLCLHRDTHRSCTCCNKKDVKQRNKRSASNNPQVPTTSTNDALFTLFIHQEVAYAN
jgi:hypothetical protein